MTYTTAAAGTGMVGLGAQAVLGIIDVGGLEKLGVAAVTLALMWWFLNREVLRNERLERKVDEAAGRQSALEAEMRRELTTAVREHAEAMRANADAHRELATQLRVRVDN
jgi:hypothetical protein